MNQTGDRKIRFSKGVKSKYSDAEREMLAAELVEKFHKTGRQFLQKQLDAGDVLICNVTAKLYQVMLEAEW